MSEPLTNTEHPPITPGRGLRGLPLTLAPLPGALAVLIAVIGPWLTPRPPTDTLGPAYQGPSPGFPLGTDYLGRDVLSRILDGGHDLLVLPLIATALATAVGVLTGVTRSAAAHSPPAPSHTSLPKRYLRRPSAPGSHPTTACPVAEPPPGSPQVTSGAGQRCSVYPAR